MDVTVHTAAQLKNTATYYFHRLRLLIHHNSPHLEMLDGEVEVDDGGQRKGKRGRGAAGKVAVFGLLKRLHRCRIQYTNRHFLPIIHEQVKPDSIVYM